MENIVQEMGYSTFNYFPLARLADFMIGITAGLYFLRPRQTSAQTSERHATFWEGASLMAFAALYLASAWVHQSLRFSVYYLPVIVWIIWLFAHGRGAVSRWLSRPILLYLGEISLAFYLIHQLVIRFITSFPNIVLYPITTSVMTLGISLAASIAIHRWYEAPLRQKLRPA